MERLPDKRNSIGKGIEAQTSMVHPGAGLTSSLVLLRLKDHQVRSRRKGWSVRQVPDDRRPCKLLPRSLGIV